MNYTHSDLIELGRKWLIKPYANMQKEYGHGGCSIVLTELKANTWFMEEPDVLGFCSNYSILIECKVSRSDFYADQKKPFRENPSFGIGSQCWYLAPQGIIPIEKIPEKWGLLEVTPERKIKVTKKAEKFEREVTGFNSEINMLVSTMRRLNILPDEHIAIQKFTPLNGFAPSKKKATFYVESEVANA